MARLSRITVPDLPHHVTQRGNRRQPLFLVDDDYALYRDLLNYGITGTAARNYGDAIPIA